MDFYYIYNKDIMNMNKDIKNAFKKAKEYNSKSLFKKECGKEYRLLYKNGLFKEASSHMPKVNRENNKKWTYEICKEISKKYTSKKEFQEKDRGAYRASSKNGWLEEFTKDYRVIGHRYKRCLYAFEFSDKSVYVGLTYDIKKRFWQHHHEKNSKVYKKIKETNEEPIFKQITNFIEYDIVGEKEQEAIEKYRKDGWIILNEKKGGSLGGLSTNKWDKKSCLEEAKKYESVTKLYRSNNSCYMYAKKNGFLDEIFDLIGRFSHKKWTYEDAITEAKKYKNISEFILANDGCYQVCCKNGWIKDFTFLERKIIKNHTFDEAIQIAKEYTTINKMFKSSNKAHRSYAYWIKTNKLQNKIKKYLKKKNR